MTVIRTERGWAGHFCCAYRCKFTRNTLVSNSKYHIVVSTVGNMWPINHDPIMSDPEPIGANRYYETMCFHARKGDLYFDADVSKEVRFNSKWSMDLEETKNPYPDLLANIIHENVVNEITQKLETDYDFSKEMDND